MKTMLPSTEVHGGAQGRLWQQQQKTSQTSGHVRMAAAVARIAMKMTLTMPMVITTGKAPAAAQSGNAPIRAGHPVLALITFNILPMKAGVTPAGSHLMTGLTIMTGTHLIGGDTLDGTRGQIIVMRTMTATHLWKRESIPRSRPLTKRSFSRTPVRLRLLRQLHRPLLHHRMILLSLASCQSLCLLASA